MRIRSKEPRNCRESTSHSGLMENNLYFLILWCEKIPRWEWDKYTHKRSRCTIGFCYVVHNYIWSRSYANQETGLLPHILQKIPSFSQGDAQRDHFYYLSYSPFSTSFLRRSVVLSRLHCTFIFKSFVFLNVNRKSRDIKLVFYTLLQFFPFFWKMDERWMWSITLSRWSLLMLSSELQCKIGIKYRHHHHSNTALFY